MVLIAEPRRRSHVLTARLGNLNLPPLFLSHTHTLPFSIFMLLVMGSTNSDGQEEKNGYPLAGWCEPHLLGQLLSTIA